MENRFLDLLYMNDEFSFFYNNIQYEIVHEYKGIVSLYLMNGTRSGELIQFFNTYEELLNNGIIDGKKIKDIVHDIKLP